jgi:tetratricopeptide (TPR) repeat protein
VDPIIPICKLGLAALLVGMPSLAVAQADDGVNRYAAARVAEMANRNDDALKGYARLYREAPDSAVLADRIFDSAIRAGDMASALRAVRAQALRGEVSAEASLLLFADAFERKNWPMALLAADELAMRNNLAFMAPILREWVDVAQGKAAELSLADDQNDPLLAYYANDQRIYLQLASGDIAKAKLGLRAIALVGGDFVRDLMLRAAPVIAAQGNDQDFADALVRTALGADKDIWTTLPRQPSRGGRLSANDGLSALHVRISAALLEQNVAEPALVLARLAVYYSPDSEPARLSLGAALDAVGLRTQALASVAGIAPTSPYWPDAVKWRVARLEPQPAARLALDAAQRWPASPTLAVLSAQTQEASGQKTDAIKAYRKIVADAATGNAAPRLRAYYHLMLATALDNAGDWPAARRELDAALVLDPDNAQILNYLGYSLVERSQDLSRATAMIRKAFQIMPDSPAITDSLGWAHFQAGEYDRAVDLLEKAARNAGSDPAINEHLGDAYWRTGRLRDARYAWGVAAQTADGDAALRLAGKIDIGLPRP